MCADDQAFVNIRRLCTGNNKLVNRKGQRCGFVILLITIIEKKMSVGNNLAFLIKIFFYHGEIYCYY